MSKKTTAAASAQVYGNEDHSFVTMRVDGMLFGIPVLAVHDVLGPRQVTRIPLAPRDVAGALNLRGRIVTVIDVRVRVGLEPSSTPEKCMSVVVDRGGELYSLRVDQVGDVMNLSEDRFERNPPTMDPQWREMAVGVYRLENELLVVLNVDRVLDVGT